MRRWNGWGDDAQDYPLRAGAQALIENRLGPGRPTTDVTREQVLASVPETCLGAGTPFDTTAETRMLHARGQSFPDWLALRFGRVAPFPDAVAMPANHDEAGEALRSALAAGAAVVPWGGGTSVAGHLHATSGDDRPVVSLSMERMNRLLALDEDCWLARFAAGTPGPLVESQLARQGYTLGHFPQSWEYSTVGGWVVTRSSGQQSLRYGRIEQLFDSGRLATPRGDWRVGGVPASSAGPDLREVVLGSEGRLGLLTEAVLRVRARPEAEQFHAVFFPDWSQGFGAARALAQSGLPLSMLRLSNAAETDTHLTLAGEGTAMQWLQRYLGWRGAGDGRCMMMLGCTGSVDEVRRQRRAAAALARRHHGIWIGTAIGARWAQNRYHGVYLRNTAWSRGYGIDTVETAVNWSAATELMEAVETAARDAFATADERVHAFTHLSHVYRQGCSVYSSFIFRLAPDHDENLQRWQRLKHAVSGAIVAHGGTISHQHGVGTDHAPWLAAEKGPLGMDLLRAMMREFDPDGRMNPGKLLAD